ncbi:hypothetical protein CERZMDRAFT_107524 [Cercospora zeae-maydis SCOH1-5]|uniref:Uncharacterized protein n=1 Tax=Cercospora zeae-maydis SCOH1-5 TaxID=717836 RepID=A0A6A6F0X6_9PEZI|nr:hypothetical protein CERZMDRAFT_107524 [Cercospora zeae-maydis SCOH1-5]
MASRRFTMQHPDIHIGLRDTSLAYRKYFVQDSLPEDAPFFKLGPNGYPAVNIGERFCRWREEHWSRRAKICGSSHVSRKDLLKHIEEHHGVSRQDRPPSKTNHNKAMCLAADEFYRTVMKHEMEAAYVEDSSTGQWHEEAAVPEEQTEYHGDSTAVVLRSNTVGNEVGLAGESDLELELREIDAEIVVTAMRVKRLEAEERLAEMKLRKVRLECKQVAMQRQRSP